MLPRELTDHVQGKRLFYIYLWTPKTEQGIKHATFCVSEIQNPGYYLSLITGIFLPENQDPKI